MVCEEVMKRPVECVSPEDTAETAAMKMRDANVGFIPVRDEDGRALGTLTDRDLALRVMAEGLPATTLVRDVMSLDVVSCRPTDELYVAEELMGHHRKSRILCLDEDGRIAGVISLSDIVLRDGDWEAADVLRRVVRREAA